IEIRYLLFDEKSETFFFVGDVSARFNKHTIIDSCTLGGFIPHGLTQLNNGRLLTCGASIIRFPNTNLKKLKNDVSSKILDESNIIDRRGKCRCMYAQDENDIYVGRLTGLVHFVKTTNGHT